MLTVLIVFVVVVALLVRLLYLARRFNMVGQERAMVSVSTLGLVFAAGVVFALVLALFGGDA